jgi:hypothetical protein
LKVPNKIGFKSTFGKLFVAKNKKIVPLRHPAIVVHNSSNIEKLKKEYMILKTLQSACSYTEKCSKFIEYKKGLVPVDYINLNCFGDWSKCEYFCKK